MGHLTLRTDGAAALAAGLGPLALYASTAPRTVALEDDGLFLMAGEHLGVAHPPGYPLYTLLCYLFMRLPGNPALLGHLSSAVLGALACVALYACARLLHASRLAALAAAWLFATAEHFWSQAIIAEVYTLNALTFFASFALILHAAASTAARQRGWPWLGAAAAFGFGLANHWPLTVLAAPGLLLAAWPARRALLGAPRRLAATAAVALACSALPYLAMVLRSWQEPLVSFYGPIRDWEAFWFYLSRSGYADVDTSPSAGWWDRLAFLGWFGKETLWQLTPPGFALAALGCVALWRTRRFVHIASGALVLLGNSALLIGLLAFDFDTYNVSVFRPYPLLCYGIVALWLALGAQFLIDRLPRPVRTVRGAPAAAVALAATAMVAYNIATSWRVNNRADSTLAERHAEHLFALLPENAVLFVSGDEEVAPLGYFRLVEERRADIEIVSTQGLVYSNRIHPARASDRRRRTALRRFIAATERPIFYPGVDEDMPHGRGMRHHGFVKEVLPDGAPGAIELAVHPASADYFEELAESAPVDGSERGRRNKLVFGYGEYLGYAVLAADPALLAQVQRSRQIAEQGFFSLMGMAEVLLAHGNDSHVAQIDAWLAKADALQGEIRTKERRGRFLYLKGFVRARQGRMSDAVALFRESRRIYPHPENAALAALTQLGG